MVGLHSTACHSTKCRVTLQLHALIKHCIKSIGREKTVLQCSLNADTQHVIVS